MTTGNYVETEYPDRQDPEFGTGTHAASENIRSALAETLPLIVLGSAAASAAVRRAPTPNDSHVERAKRRFFTAKDADDEGVVGRARGGRAPHLHLNRSGFAAAAIRSRA
jgi:hypothetical protein